MLTFLKRLFSPPTFEGEDDNRNSYLLNFITIAYFGVSLLTISVSFFGSKDYLDTARQVLIQSLPLLIALFAAQILLHRKQLKAAIYVFSILLWLSHTYDSYLSGGASAYSLYNYVISIMVFGLLLGRWYAAGAAALSVIASVVFLVMGNQGLIPEALSKDYDASIISVFTFLFVAVLSAALLSQYLKLLNESMDKLRQANQSLKESESLLEQRVTDRTRALAIVAEVGTATATILETNRLLQEVTDLTKERFNLYHSHIYLLDEGGKNLVLAAGAGEPGRIMATEKRSIPLDREQSLVARAARERRGVTVNDVSQALDFLPNPLLPNTRSELAVPMIVGGNVIGVFDIQSDQVGRFTEADVNVQTTLAAQLATSIQNVRSFEQSRAQVELETMINTIGQRIQRAATVQETLQTAVRELGLALGASRVSVGVGTDRTAETLR